MALITASAATVLRDAAICRHVLTEALARVLQAQARAPWAAVLPIRTAVALPARLAAAVRQWEAVLLAAEAVADALSVAAVEAVHLAADAAKANVAIKSYKNRRKQL